MGQSLCGAGWTRSCVILVSGGVWGEAVLTVRVYLYGLGLGQGLFGEQCSIERKFVFHCLVQHAPSLGTLLPNPPKSTVDSELDHQKQLPVGLRAALRREVPCKAFFRPLKQPRCGLTAEKGTGSAERVIGMLLNLLPVKDPPFPCSFPHRAFQSSLDHRSCLVFGSVETSHMASSRQRMSEASEGTISRCFYSVLPHSFAGLHLRYLALFPLALWSPSSSLLSALVSGAYFSMSLFCTMSS